MYLRDADWREARLAELCHTEGYGGRHDNAGRVTERCGLITSKKTQSRFWTEGRPVNPGRSKSRGPQGPGTLPDSKNHRAPYKMHGALVDTGAVQHN